MATLGQCPKCGKAYWNPPGHECHLTASPNTGDVSPNAVGDVPPCDDKVLPAKGREKEDSPDRTQAPSPASRNARWRAKNPEAHRTYMRDYMRKRRAKA